MPYTKEQLQKILQWLTQRVPNLIQHGCPLCGAPAAGFGVEQLKGVELNVPLLAVACRTCGHIMLFNEVPIFGSSTAH